MQKFTRALTREIELAGERLAVTFSEEGMTLRPVGSRRPPFTMSWEAVVCACFDARGGEAPPADRVAEAVKGLKVGEKAPRARRAGEAGAHETGAEAGAEAGTESGPEGAAEAASGAPAGSAAGEEEETAEPPSAPPAAAPRATGGNGHGGATLPALLSRLERWLGTHRARYSHGLLAGASPADLGPLQEALGRSVPEELRTWLGWHNGQDPEVFGALAEDWHPMSAAEIAKTKKELDAEGHAGWHREWIPFLDDDNGSFLVLDPTQPGTPVRECWRGRAEHAVVAPSLAAWVEQLVSGLEQGKYQEDPERGGMTRG